MVPLDLTRQPLRTSTGFQSAFIRINSIEVCPHWGWSSLSSNHFRMESWKTRLPSKVRTSDPLLGPVVLTSGHCCATEATEVQVARASANTQNTEVLILRCRFIAQTIASVTS